MRGYAAICVSVGASPVGLFTWKKRDETFCRSGSLPNVVNNEGVGETAGHKSDSAGSGNVTYCTLAAMFFSDTKELLNFHRVVLILIFPPEMVKSWTALWSQEVYCVLRGEVGERLVIVALASSYGQTTLATQTAVHAFRGQAKWSLKGLIPERDAAIHHPPSI